MLFQESLLKILTQQNFLVGVSVPEPRKEGNGFFWRPSLPGRLERFTSSSTQELRLGALLHTGVGFADVHPPHWLFSAHFSKSN